MPVLKKVWDRQAGDGGAFVEMFSLNAVAAVKNDPKRYSEKKPGDKPEAEVTHKKVRPEPNEAPIPADWQNLPWQDRKKLALHLGAERNVTSDIANALIAAEVRRQSKAPMSAEPLGPPEVERATVQVDHDDPEVASKPRHHK